MTTPEPRRADSSVASGGSADAVCRTTPREDTDLMTTAELLRFDEDTTEIGVLVNDKADDTLFWATVAEDAIDYEYEYGTVEAAVPDRLLHDDSQMYDEEAVARWVRTKVKAPVWRWYRFVDDHDEEEERMLFVVAAEMDEGAFFGAVIDLIRKEKPNV